MFIESTQSWVLSRRSPHGERGLKWCEDDVSFDGPCRSPHGERGLKCDDTGVAQAGQQSLSSWRAWIEIGVALRGSRLMQGVALLMESVD